MHDWQVGIYLLNEKVGIPIPTAFARRCRVCKPDLRSCRYLNLLRSYVGIRFRTEEVGHGIPTCSILLLELTLQDLWVLNFYSGLLYGGISPDNGGFL